MAGKLPRLQLEWPDLRVFIQARTFDAATKADMFLMGGAVIEKAFELERGTPTIKTDMILHVKKIRGL